MLKQVTFSGNVDYYPFGMVTPGRSYSAGSGYRFGFNGKESDSETYGSGNIYDYGFRIYNPRLGKFLSVDPLSGKFAFSSPYVFALNDVIRNIDFDGLETYNVIILDESDGGYKIILQLVDATTPSLELNVVRYLGMNVNRPIDPTSQMYTQLQTTVLSNLIYVNGDVYTKNNDSPYQDKDQIYVDGQSYQKTSHPYAGEHKKDPLFEIRVHGVSKDIAGNQPDPITPIAASSIPTVGVTIVPPRWRPVLTNVTTTTRTTTNINFAAGSSAIVGRDPNLDALGATLSANPAMTVTIDFYTTNSFATDGRQSIRDGGSGSLNQDRFNQIVTYLSALGVNPSQLNFGNNFFDQTNTGMGGNVNQQVFIISTPTTTTRTTWIPND